MYFDPYRVNVENIVGLEGGLGTAASKDVPESGNASATEVVMGDDTRLTDSRNAADVYAWAKTAIKPEYTANEVGALPSNTLYAGSASAGGAATSAVKVENTLDVSMPGSNSQTANTVSFDGSGNHKVLFRAKKYSVSASNWDSVVDSDGYYTCPIILGESYNAYECPKVMLCGSTNDTLPTFAERAAYGLCIFYMGDSTNASMLTVKAKTKPTTTFYIRLKGKKME